MQSLDISDEDRNPNSYTREEILRELRAVDGSRKTSYRFDHLDQDDNFIRDITNLVQSGSVSNNALATIKRTASFTVQDDGEFDFLIDRIKPWCRVHMPPKPLTVMEERTRRWFNTFNGTPGTTGDEEFDPGLVIATGQDIDQFGGTLHLSDDWSALGDKSLKLGADGSSNPGSITVQLQPMDRWQVRCYLNVPSGGSFSLQIGNDDFLELELDDAAGSYSLGSMDLSSLSGDLIGQPVKMTLDADGGEIRVRFFWSDIHGSTPDFDDSFTFGMWEPGGTFMAQGGGDPAVFIDNVEIFQVEDSPSQTSDDVNFVDFPLGVFLLETTDTNVTADGTSLVDIEAYDKLKILEDDAVTGRLADSGTVVVDDDFRRDLDGFWGSTPEGIQWDEINTGPDTTVSTDLSPRAHGWIEISGDYSAHRTMLVGDDIYDNTEIFMSLAIDPAAVGDNVYVSIVTRYQNNVDKYELVMVFQTDGGINLEVWSGGQQVGSAMDTGLTHAATRYFNVRTRTTHDRIQASMWLPAADYEPEQWMFKRFIGRDNPDPTWEEGRVGITFHSSSGFSGGDARLTVRRFVLNSNPLNYYQRVIEHLIGDRPASIEPTDRVIPTTREWEAGTAKRVIVNELLSQINYGSLTVDPNGVYIATPYRSPDERTVEYEYRDNELSVMTPEATREFDLHNVPNRWILVESNPDRNPLKVVYDNNDPTSPLSIPRRGRIIVRSQGTEDDEDEGDEEESESQATNEATNKSMLIKKAIRLGNESTQVYEHIDFETAFMPFHDNYDCYRLRRSDLGINAKYLEHKWSMNLEPGALMSHRARRIVEQDVSFDDSIVNDDLEVTGVLTANNMAWGIAPQVEPVPDTPTSFAVTGLELEGSGRIFAFTTAHSSVPGERFIETSMNYPTDSGFTGFVYRNNDVTTNIHWFTFKEQ